MTDKIEKTDAEWRAELIPEAFRVLRRQGTEPAFTGAHWDNKDDGRYLCAACGAELFASSHKYDSGSGWPSFWQALDGDVVDTVQDSSHGMIRTEVRCARCDSHLGHVFPDGPRPTGERFCINSVSLKFEPEA
jgi:peptide-methionine (R)-S-oxide reductase